MYICKFCNKNFIKSQSLAGHTSQCEKNPKKRNPFKDSCSCKYCNKKFKTAAIAGGHIVSCKKGPYRENWLKSVPSTKGYHHTKETKKRLSEIRSKILEEKGLGGFKDIKWYKIKNILGEEYILRGTWEVKFAKTLNSKNIVWKRKIYIKYVDSNGIERTYTPDFYIPSKNIYYEVKGYYSEVDKDKINKVVAQNNIILKLLFKKDIDNLTA